jgi:hypothetical protein
MICTFAGQYYLNETIPFKKPTLMKTIAKKLVPANPTAFVRNISLSLACLALCAAMLYILINSPA